MPGRYTETAGLESVLIPKIVGKVTVGTQITFLTTVSGTLSRCQVCWTVTQPIKALFLKI